MYDNNTYLVPSFLAEENKPLAAVEVLDVSGIWDQDPGVSHSSHPAEFKPDPYPDRESFLAW